MQRMKASDFPQEVLNLFDRYVHGGIDRRQFIDKASKYAVGGMTATAMFEALKPNFALGEQVSATDSRIKGQEVSYPSPQGNSKTGGYPGDEEKAVEAFGKLDGAKRTEDFVAAANWIKGHAASNGRLGAVGFCFGGGVVNTLAVRLGDGLLAGVPFYGAQPPAADVAKIKAHMLIHYAGMDERIDAGWPAFEAALKANRVHYEQYTYAGAQHGFNNDTTPRYDEASAKLAWQRTMDWFNKYVRATS